MNPLFFNFNRDEQIATFVPQAKAGAERPKAAGLSQKMFHLYRGLFFQSVCADPSTNMLEF